MSLTTLPLMVQNRQPDAETTDPQVTARLTEWFGRARNYIVGYAPIDDSHLADPDTHLSHTQLLSRAIGFVGCDTDEARTNRAPDHVPVAAQTTARARGVRGDNRRRRKFGEVR
ncbi:hypothetical protein [Parasphingorhabdus pacifica]